MQMALERKCGFYEKYVKRLLDIFCSLLAIVIFAWLYIIIAILVRLKIPYGWTVGLDLPSPQYVRKEIAKLRSEMAV